jgi:hypothetical protein
MRWRRWTSGLLVVALLALCPVAHASPLDPTWIAGFWDDGDHDNLVLRFMSMASAADMNLVVPLVPMRVVTPVATPESESFAVRTFSFTVSRAPPSSRKTHHPARQ